MSSNSVAAAALLEGYPPGWWASRSSLANSRPCRSSLAPGASVLPIALVADSRAPCATQRVHASQDAVPWSSPSLQSFALAPYEAALPNSPIWNLPCRPQQRPCPLWHLRWPSSASRRWEAAYTLSLVVGSLLAVEGAYTLWSS